jgi:hypothetical protein
LIQVPFQRKQKAEAGRWTLGHVVGNEFSKLCK